MSKTLHSDPDWGVFGCIEAIANRASMQGVDVAKNALTGNFTIALWLSMRECTMCNTPRFSDLLRSLQRDASSQE